MLRFIKEWIPLVLIITIIILSRIYVWGSATVKGPSMDPTLMNGQRIITLKIGDIKRGDIVVADETMEQTKINKPEATENNTVIVKRVVGMPGDTLTFNNDMLTIVDASGKTVMLDETEAYLETYLELFDSNELAETYLSGKAMDNLPSTDRQIFADMASRSEAFTTSGNPIDASTTPYSKQFTVQVPEGQYYLLGDNRVISSDSRAVGNFTEEQIRGKLLFRFWPFSEIGTVD